MTTTTTKTKGAEGSQTSGAEPMAGQQSSTDTLPQIPSMADYMEQFRAAEGIYAEKLKFKEGFDPKPWDFRAFRHDEAATLGAAIAQDGFVQVKRDRGIHGFKFNDWLEDVCFDEDGCVSEGQLVEKGTGRLFRELYYFVRPRVAKIARERVELEHSEKYVNAVNSRKAEASHKGVRVLEDDRGQDSPWDS